MPAEPPHRRYSVIIPACDEEPCISAVLDELRAALPREGFEIAVGVNGSRDRTAALAREAGALVAETAARGYGHGCHVAIERLETVLPPCNAYIFFAADGASDPRDIAALIAEYERGAPMVLGCRTRLPENRATLEPQYILANRVFGILCGLLTGNFFADLGPLRLIDRSLFHTLRLREWTYGWTIEAQIRAVLLGASVVEIPARERRRIAGEQKVSRVSWQRTLSIGLKIVAAGFRARFGDYSDVRFPSLEGVTAAAKPAPAKLAS